MKRARPPRSSDSRGDQQTDTSTTTMSSSNSPSPAATAAGTKRRRNNPDECCLTCKLRKASASLSSPPSRVVMGELDVNTAAQVKCSGKMSNDPCDNCARLKLDCSFTQTLNGSQPLGMGTCAHQALSRPS